MKKVLFCLLCLVSISVQAESNYSFNCNSVGNDIKRCVNDEVICYVYDSSWTGFTKAGRSAGISCLPAVKKQEPQPFFIMVPKDKIK